ncbi:hypothetical protein Pyrde_0111 [Pyrodictium delaneyi]|uniref:DUF429 domain-containing protein n=1 Tax=Pyrodictium delaneyi TaxID=1273541 RepID=A0A0N7JCR9_9CREN|nr:DUF429 domain-containing protein [Pyrodictium delaneyi]ALL00161.1 hypothetical protein Pyrde_0111 [Pyrodictium delaneyi]OWJ54251.1 hypothetical protein Pdsh_07105 [Pyrodictium delaneyi]
MPCFAGVDLAASPRRPSGVAIVCTTSPTEHLHIKRLTMLYSDAEITELILRDHARMVAIDAPLSLPPEGQGFRNVERQLLSLGGRLLPLTLSSMRKLALRAIKLKEALEKAGVVVIETHPSSVLRIADCSYIDVCNLFGLHLPREASRHEEDALVAALVAFCATRDCGYRVEGSDGAIYVLRPGICRTLSSFSTRF